MTPERMQEIREAAQRAHDFGDEVSSAAGAAYLDFEDRVPPGAVLELIAEVERLKQAAMYETNMRLNEAYECNAHQAQWESEMAALKGENERLRRERDDAAGSEAFVQGALSDLQESNHLNRQRACALAFDHGRLMEEAAELWHGDTCGSYFREAWRECDQCRTANPYRSTP